MHLSMDRPRELDQVAQLTVVANQIVRPPLRRLLNNRVGYEPFDHLLSQKVFLLIVKALATFLVPAPMVIVDWSAEVWAAV